MKADQTRGPFDPGGQPETRSGQPMELGLFAWNLSSGLTASKAVLADPDRMRDFWHWDTALHLNQEAERIGYEYQVPYGRWRGYGGASGWNDDSLDFLGAAACLAPVTSSLALFSTAHVTYKFHPVHLAKMGATIDFVSKGRWGLNVVTGAGNQNENRIFGQEPVHHDTAYDMADEFMTCLKWIWASDEPLDFEGDYYQSYGVRISPKPVRQPRPVLMNAGNSDVGMAFAARHCDWAFLTGRTVEEYGEMVKKVHALAAGYGRKIRAATMVHVIMADTDAAANEIVDWVRAEVDEEAVRNFFVNHASESTSNIRQRYPGWDLNDEYLGMGRDVFVRWAMGMSAWKLYGSYETVAESIRALHEVGVESILTCFLDPIRGLHQIEDDLLPILKKMGLRK
ncbi:MAG TPA: LLM class flavin-dependent oxidoreductase [Chloroflexota bacterium]|nr:LLM class flavin-dependent oxidoreductase [Chloroflexota bacterium]